MYSGPGPLEATQTPTKTNVAIDPPSISMEDSTRKRMNASKTRKRLIVCPRKKAHHFLHHEFFSLHRDFHKYVYYLSGRQTTWSWSGQNCFLWIAHRRSTQVHQVVDYAFALCSYSRAQAIFHAGYVKLFINYYFPWFTSLQAISSTCITQTMSIFISRWLSATATSQG